ncbi:hypothetical protein ACWDYJ_33635 [Streptomyces sp. NPDC003042]
MLADGVEERDALAEADGDAEGDADRDGLGDAEREAEADALTVELGSGDAERAVGGATLAASADGFGSTSAVSLVPEPVNMVSASATPPAATTAPAPASRGSSRLDRFPAPPGPRPRAGTGRS